MVTATLFKNLAGSFGFLRCFFREPFATIFSARVVPYWENEIVPNIKAGRKILITAHGNSLRSLIKHLDNISDKDIVGVNVPTAVPLVYELDENMRPIRSYYLGDQEAIKQKMAAVAAQGKAGK